jgi:hypothetical protein
LFKVAFLIVPAILYIFGLLYLCTINPVFIFAGWIVKTALVMVVLVVGACGLVGCATCFYHCCKRVCSYRCPTLPTCELTWYASSDDARQARTMLARAKFAPISLKPRRVKSAKKVSRGYLPVVFVVFLVYVTNELLNNVKHSFFIPIIHLNHQIFSYKGRYCFSNDFPVAKHYLF